MISELAGAFPGLPLRVLPFEEFAGHSDTQLERLVHCTAPQQASGLWLSRDNDDEPQVSNSVQELKLMAKFADDLTWLESGADGLARLCLLEETERGDTAPA